MHRMLLAAACIMAATVSPAGASGSPAAGPVVTENLTGIVSGSQTFDTRGYFGPAGSNLSGAKISIYLQYVPGLLGPSQTCRNHACTYNVSAQMPDTPGSLLITITINGHRAVYSPSYEAVVFFPTQTPFQLTIDADAFSGFGIGLPGLQFAALFKSAPVFGQPLSPGNRPVLQASASDYLSFYDAQSQTPVEQLTYTPTGGTK